MRDLAVESSQSYTLRTCYDAVFTYAEREYKLRITDPVFTSNYQSLAWGERVSLERRERYLCVSLTEPFGGDGRCHKLVAAIIEDSAS